LSSIVTGPSAARSLEAPREALNVEPASVRLDIHDDGKGLTLPEISATGLGLRAKSYRASLLGAKFHITRLDHAGTCVVCECPQAV
jgi:signal transduction histidine kinase